ncbi:MAG: sodium:proline symporter, partial [Succinivibrio sp.]|nr:sodium:proline symporter [Succinivibrio sp.]
NSGILKLVSYAWAGFGAAFGPTVLISVFWKKMTLPGAILGMIAGAVTVIIWEIGGYFDLYSLVPGFIISSVVIFVVSLLTQKNNSEVERLFEKLEANFWIEVKDR